MKWGSLHGGQFIPIDGGLVVHRLESAGPEDRLSQPLQTENEQQTAHDQSRPKPAANTMVKASTASTAHARNTAMNSAPPFTARAPGISVERSRDLAQPRSRRLSFRWHRLTYRVAVQHLRVWHAVGISCISLGELLARSG